MEHKLPEEKIKALLIQSVYPTATTAEIDMVYDYCIARDIDPLQKLVHLVPQEFKIREGKIETKVKRAVIWEGIGMYRVVASRTGEYAGQDAPQFGPLKQKEFSKTWDGQTTKWTVAYHEWISVTVYRLVNGVRCPYTVPVYWEEEFVGGKAPNPMWTKRPIGQHIKVATAQSLRAAFPEISQGPSAEEMEGRTIGIEDWEADVVSDAHGDVEMPRQKPAEPADPKPAEQKPAEQKPEEQKPAEQKPVVKEPEKAEAKGEPKGDPVSASMVKVIRRGLSKSPKGTEEALLEKFGARDVESLLAADINAILEWINKAQKS